MIRCSDKEIDDATDAQLVHYQFTRPSRNLVALFSYRELPYYPSRLATFTHCKGRSSRWRNSGSRNKTA
jgi:hypothetical protein